MSAVAEREQLATARLEALAGHWHTEGDVYESAYGAAARWRSEERCEWLPGERFLINRWDARVGERDFQGMAIFGHDEKRGYFATFYDSAGNAPTYRVSAAGSRLTFSGEAQRAVYEFAPDGAAMKIRWEWRDDQGWHPLCDLTARRAGTAAEVVRDCFAAYEAQDRGAIDRLFADDFTFSSPRDDRIGKAAWFERCWPGKDKIRAFRIERICEQTSGEVFVRYSAERVADRVRFRNTELIRVAHGQIREVDVYFGRDQAQLDLSQ